MRELPIDSHLPAIVAAAKEFPALVLTAPPGAGKTTRIPRALLDAGFADDGQILVLEPRRLAARLAALRVAEELGQSPGGTVGYSIRYESVGGDRTRIRFLTEAILSRRIISDPGLQGVSTVILDEFHERHLSTDLALAFLKRLQPTRPGLKIIVMSATMDADPVAAFLGNAHTLSLAESPFTVETEYEEKQVDRPLHEQVAGAVTRLARSAIDGDVLVFLPGAAEIGRTREALRSVADRFELAVMPLHGDMPASEQQSALAPSAKIKIILATNVAETSITIPGIAAVIDSGLARVAGHSAWTGFPNLTTMKISKSSANQRAGRAGRTRKGRVIRLYTKFDFDTRPDYELPEIKRADLAETTLMLHGAGLRSMDDFSWFERPAGPAVESAENLLLRLGAIDAAGSISDTGKRMLKYPVHPRLARLIIESEKMGVGEDGILLAALMSERDIRLGARADFRRGTSPVGKAPSNSSDLIEMLEQYREAESAGFDSDRIRAFGLDHGAVDAVRRAHRQLQSIRTGKKCRDESSESSEEALLIAALTAFPERVAKRRAPASRDLLLSGGGVAVLSAKSVVHTPMFVVAADVEERRESTGSPQRGTVVRLASAIEIEWLAALFPEAISQTVDLVWNDKGGRVDEVRRTMYGQIALEESTLPAAPSENTAHILATAVLDRGLAAFRDLSSLPMLQERLALLAEHFPDEGIPTIDAPKIRETVEALCRGRRNLEEVESLSITEAFTESLTPGQRRLLERETPQRVGLKTGRAVKVHYESGKPPWIESRLQDFFGMMQTPAICAGKVSLTIHLLAPNGRAVQVTRDIEGFWERHYPAVRRELQRRYPKHSWPAPQDLQD